MPLMIGPVTAYRNGMRFPTVSAQNGNTLCSREPGPWWHEGVYCPPAVFIDDNGSGPSGPDNGVQKGMKFYESKSFYFRIKRSDCHD